MAFLAFVGVLAIIGLVVLLFFVAVGLFQWLWNITMPDVFELRSITFWQAFRLLLLAAILFGGDHAVERTTTVVEEKASAAAHLLGSTKLVDLAEGN